MYLIPDALRRAERLQGGGPAVVCGSTTASYRELAARCRRLSGGLAALGVGRGDRVAVLMQNCHRYLEAYFAVPGMGAVIVPLNNRHALPEHRYILEDASVKVLIADEANRPMAAELASSVERLIVGADDYERLLRTSEELSTPEDLDAEELAGLYYTGGTTGAAKGVMLSHRNLMTNALHSAIALSYTESESYLHAAPMFHLADGLTTYPLTWLGGRHVFVPGFESTAVLRAIEEHRVTCVTLVPTMINSLVNHPETSTTDLSSLRQIMHGGAPISTDLLRRAVDLLSCSFIQAYGMTEAAPLVTVLPHEEELLTDRRLRSAGRVIAGVEVDVVRPEGTSCAPGEVGEIVTRGPNLMQGYWNKPDETAAVMREGWYWTGDLGYRDEADYVYIVDRSKDMIVSGGENVYSVEVEDAVCGHPAILEAAVVGVPDPEWGESVHAVVVLRPGADLTLEELRGFCKERIAGYKCPRSLELLDELPKSGAGKILKREIRERHWTSQSRRVH